MAELENNIQNFKVRIQKKDKQLLKFSKLIKATKTEYQKLHKENTKLKKYIVNKEKHDQQKQKRYQHYQKQSENDSNDREVEEEEENENEDDQRTENDESANVVEENNQQYKKGNNKQNT